MGATMAVELIGRGNISVDKIVLDAVFTIRMGIKAKPFEELPSANGRKYIGRDTVNTYMNILQNIPMHYYTFST